MRKNKQAGYTIIEILFVELRSDIFWAETTAWLSVF